VSIKEILKVFIDNGYLPSKEIFFSVMKGKIKKEELEKVFSFSKKLELDNNLTVIDLICYKLLKNQEKNVNWKEFEKFKVFVEKNKGQSPLKTVLSFFMNEKEIEDYFKNFVEKFFKEREFKFLELSKRSEIENNKEEDLEDLKEDKQEIKENKVEKNEKESNLFKFLKKEEVLVGDYKSISQNFDAEENIFDEVIESNKEGKTKDNKENKAEEIGEMNKEFINEIKEKIKNTINANYQTNKVEWVENDFKIIKSFKASPKKVEVVDFLKYFRSKYKKISEMLMNRLNGLSKDLVSIDNLKDNQTYTVIGMIREVIEKNNFLTGILEDLSGEIRFKVNYKEVKEAIEIVPDDVAAFVGKKKGNTFYIEKVIYPDIPNNSVKWLKDYGINEDIYALILSDVHIGSRLFLKEKFKKFIEWLNGKNNKYYGKIGFVLVNGDVVDGIGVYPEQIEELEIGSGYEQYKTFASFLELIPSEINVFVAPGNHDIVRQAEPQPIFPKDIAEPLLELNNVSLISNPSLILLKEHIKLLNYHGYSYDYFINEIDYLRGRLSYERIHELMRILLKKRHLVPSYKAAPIAPEHEDHLVIEEIPNMLVSGHIHYSSVGDYKGIKLLSSSCWQDITPFQEKVGHNPDPGKIPLINLKDGSIKILHF